MRITATAIAASLTLGMGAAQAAELVTNGSFSSSAYTTSNEFGLAAGGQGVTGWTGNDGYNIWFPSAAASVTENAGGQYSFSGQEKLWSASPSPGGGAFIGLDGDQVDPNVQGQISQTINGLTPGAQYNLTFDTAAGQLASRTGATTEYLAVSLGTQTFDTVTLNNDSKGFTGWVNYTFTFTASAASEVLSFLSIGTPGGLPPIGLLDDVSLTPAPEPLSVAVVGAGLIGLGALRLRRRV